MSYWITGYSERTKYLFSYHKLPKLCPHPPLLPQSRQLNYEGQGVYHWVSRAQGDTADTVVPWLHSSGDARAYCGRLEPWDAVRTCLWQMATGLASLLSLLLPAHAVPHLCWAGTFTGGGCIFFLFLWQLSELVDLTLFIFSWWPLKGCGSSFSGCVSIAQVSILLTLYQSTSCTSGFLRAVTRHFSDAVMLLSEVPMVAVSNPNKFVIKQKASLNRVDASLNLTKFQLIPLCTPSHFEFTVRHCKLQN